MNYKIKKFKTEEEWLSHRKGKITGTKLKDILIKRNGNGHKAGFYQILAERVAVPATQENPMSRGKRLEIQAIEEFEKETGKKVDKNLVIWCRKDNEDIAFSPDGFIGKTEAVEVKCLSSARHIEAWMTQKIPTEYIEQSIQPFIVNEDLRKLYFVFYDNRMPKSLFYIEVNRKEIQDKIDEYLELERDVLKKIKELEDRLTF